MATQESNLRDRAAGTRIRRGTGNEKLSMVVDRPSPSGLGLLILPFSTIRGEEALGRQIGLMVQHRLSIVPELTVGHGSIVATGPEGRRYVPLYHALSAEQSTSCGTSWRASAVLSGTISLQPNLRWSLTLRAMNERTTLFEDTLVGDTEDVLDAPGDVAITMANALGLQLDATQLDFIEKRETSRLDALLTFLGAADIRQQHGVTQANPSLARAQLLTAASLDPEFKAPIDMLAADLGANPKDATAIEELISAMGNLGQSGAAAVSALARALDDLGHADLSTMLATASLGQESNQASALAISGHHAYRSGHFARARKIAQALLDLDPESPVPYALLGNILAAGNRIPGASIHWEISLSLDPDQPKVLQRLGSYLATSGQHERAYEVLRRLDQLGGSSADSLYQLGMAAYRLGKVDEAIWALQASVALQPDLPYVHIMLARSYGRSGQHELALEHDQKALNLSPTYWPSALAIGYATLNQGRVEEALLAYTEVARVRPDLPEALYGLGIALVASNMLDDGLATLIRARELQADNVPVLCALTLAYLRVGRLEDAQATLYDAMLLSPNNPDVAHCMEEVHRFSLA